MSRFGQSSVLLPALFSGIFLKIVAAIEVIKEIERLPAEEKAKVMNYIEKAHAGPRKLSPDELVALADAMVASSDPVEADRIERKILSGFYGK